jgi:hypothetical protein
LTAPVRELEFALGEVHAASGESNCPPEEVHSAWEESICPAEEVHSAARDKAASAGARAPLRGATAGA